MKRILAFIIALMNVALVHVSAAGLSVKQEDVSRIEKTFTVVGEAPSGTVVGYSVVREGESKAQADKLYAVGDTVANETGKFTIVFEFKDDAPSGKYIVYVNALGETTDTVDIDFVNYISAEAAIKSATSDAELDGIFKSEQHFQGLQFIGFSPDIYKSISSETEQMKVATGVYNSVNLSEETLDNILSAYNTYLGIAMLNEKIQGGLEKINPIFEEKKYSEVTDNELKSYLSSRMTEMPKYNSLDEFNSEYKLQNILYLLEKATVGEFIKYVNKYKAELSVESASEYSVYTGFASTKKENTASQYFKLTKTNKVKTKAQFLDMFAKAVNNVKNSGGSGNGGTGGSGGSGSSGGKYTGGGGFAVSGTTGSLSNNSSVTDKNDFVDIENYQWAKEAIKALADKGIVSGTGNGKFSPEQYVTREQLVKMVMLSIGVSGDYRQDFFNDVDNSSWYASYVNEAATKNIIYGISDNEFGVGQYVTRQDLAVIVVRAAKTKGFFASEIASENVFADDSDISAYAKEAVNILFANGVVNGKGDNKFMPADYCTRAEAAKIIYGIFK